MIRLSIAAASLALLAAHPGAAQSWDGYNASMQHQYGTYDSYKPSYDDGHRYGYSRYGYNSYRPSYGYGHRYGYSRYGYGYRCTYNCY